MIAALSVFAHFNGRTPSDDVLAARNKMRDGKKKVAKGPHGKARGTGAKYGKAPYQFMSRFFKWGKQGYSFHGLDRRVGKCRRDQSPVIYRGKGSVEKSLVFSKGGAKRAMKKLGLA